MQLHSAHLDGPVSYADFGGDGSPLVLVHGLAGSHLNWLAVAPKLAGTYHVYAPDLVGFGKTPLAGRAASLETNQALLTRFLEEVAGAQALVVGHSMGGLLTLRVAAARPDLVSAAVLLDAASPGGSGPMSSQQELLVTLLNDVEEGSALVHAYVVATGPEQLVDESFGFMHERPVGGALRAAHVELERERAETPESGLAYLQALGDLLARADDYEWFDAAVAAVKAPILVLHGLQDRIVPPANMQRAAALRPDWETAWLDGVGHNPQMEAPEEFLAAVEPFLAKAAPEPAKA